MLKADFLQLAQEAARQGMVLLPHSVQRHVMRALLEDPYSKVPALADYTPVAFHTCYETGGMSGGNCWGDEPREYSVTPERPDAFDCLEAFLEMHFPDLTLVAFRKLRGKMTNDQCTHVEYYGNTTDYAIRCLWLEDLWAVLEEENLVCG